MIKLYNTLSQKKENFKPRKKNEVGLYTCGPTVYNYAHIGNLRSFIFADILARTLKYNGFSLKWIMNITDVDDKTIKNSKLKYPNLAPKQALRKFTKFYEKLFWQDLKKLNILKPTHSPRATETILEMQKLIVSILKQKYGYIKDGSIYFDLKKYIKNYKYGKLVKLDIKKLKINDRIDADEYEKENLQDFVLWKGKKLKEPSWDFKIKNKNYPGRPGWHIECSAMSKKYLGSTFDIHSGGIDLKFPHHEDEIAQSIIGYKCQKPVNFWMHNEHVLVEGKKMAKSLKNFYTLDDLIKKNINPLSYRYLFLNTHYGSKFNFTWKSINGAQNAINNLREKIKEFKEESSQKSGLSMKAKIYEKKFLYFLCDNLNTPKALALMWQLIKDKKISGAEKYTLLMNFDKVLGLSLDKIKKDKIPQKIRKFAKLREKYRAQKNWEKADQVRIKIQKNGYSIEDTKKGIEIKKE